MMIPHGRWLSFSLLLSLSSGAVLASADFPSPRLPGRSILLENTATTHSYNPSFKQADWAFYSLGQNELQDCIDRPSNFRADARIPKNQSASLADYSGSGYDRGHLSPAGDNKWSPNAMTESFLLSNISPQPPAFNRGVWSRLENLVRAWASKEDGLWVTTGPILKKGLSTIGDGAVAVPEYFYKVLATQSGDKLKAVAFLMPTDAGNDFSKYAMTVKDLEEISGLDFLVDLPGEREVESRIDLKKWDMKAKFSYFPCKALSAQGFDWAWGLSR